MILLQLVPQKDRAKLETTFGTANKKFCLTTMHSISNFSVSTLHSCFLINANDRIKADKFTVGNKYDSDESFICAVIKVQLGKEESSEMVLCPILGGINLSHIYAREVR